MNSLDFAGGWDIAAFKDQCRDQREFALHNPVTSKSAKRLSKYRWKLGPWYLCFTMEVWAKPVWHGSAIVFRDDQWKTVDYKHRIEIPQNVPIFTDEWEPDHFAQARYLLSEMYGPIIRPGRDQRVLETRALMALHWHVDYEGNVRSIVLPITN